MLHKFINFLTRMIDLINTLNDPKVKKFKLSFLADSLLVIFINYCVMPL